MKRILLICLSLLSLLSFSQTTYTYRGTGEWEIEENWSPSYPGTTIDAQDNIRIASDASVTVTSFTTINGTLLIRGTLTSRSILKVNGKITNDGLLESKSIFEVTDTIINQGEFLSNSVTYLFGVLINEGDFKSNSIFENYGTLINQNTMASNSTFSNFGDFINNGTITGFSTLEGGNKSHSGDFVVTQSISPKTRTSSIGTYTFNNNLAFSGFGKARLQINEDSIDKLIVQDTLFLDGAELDIPLLDDDVLPPLGFKDTIFKAKHIGGFFNRLDLPDLGENELFIFCTDTTIIVEVIPRSTSFTYAGAGEWDDFKNWVPRYPGKNTLPGDTIIIPDTSIVKASGLVLNGPLIVAGELENTSLTMNGKVIIEESGYLQSSGVINDTIINSGRWRGRSNTTINGVLINNGSWSATATTTNNGSILNDGVINLNSNFKNFGSLTNNPLSEFEGPVNIRGNNLSHTGNYLLRNTIYPESKNSDIGTYTFDNELEFATNARLFLDFKQDSIDKLIVKDKLILDGTLAVTIEAGETLPEVGFRDTIIISEVLEGVFRAEQLPDLGDSKEFKVVYEENLVILEVVESSPTSVKSAKNFSSFNIYPNPTRGNISIKNENQGENLQVRVLDLLGNVITETTSNSEYLELDLGNETSIYLVEVTNSSGLKKVARVVKE